MSSRRRKKKASHPATVGEAASYVCPSCLETVDSYPDPGGGHDQTYVEDCAVCCRPNVLRAVWNDAAGQWTLDASRES
jgi:cysteine-rich CPXCG protein